MIEAFQQLFSSEEAISAPRQQLLARVRTAVEQRLTGPQREAVEMFFFLGMSQSEIARRLGISQQVVHKRIYGVTRNGRRVGGALRKLQKSLTQSSSALPWE